MSAKEYKIKSAYKLVTALCFMAFGICAFSNSIYSIELVNVIFGMLLGLFFGWLFKAFLTFFIGIFNHKLKKENGKKSIKFVVNEGMLFVTPFALLALVAVFYLNWSMTMGFISAGMMAVGTATSIEIGKLKGKHEIRNTVVTSLVSFCFSFIWILSYTFLSKAPSLINGGIDLIGKFISGGGMGL